MSTSSRGMYQAVLTGDWGRLGATLSMASIRFPQAVDNALEQEAQFFRRKIVEGIDQQAPGGKKFRPLSPVTLAIRKLMGFRGTKALIESGELRKNIVAKRVGRDHVFVGILYSARGDGGRKLADIGRIHEYGAVITKSFSPKRMALIRAAMKHVGKAAPSGGGGVGVITIPARPFIGPVIEMYGGQRGAQRMLARVSRGMGGMLGVVNHPDLGGRAPTDVFTRLATPKTKKTSIGRGAARVTRVVKDAKRAVAKPKAKKARPKPNPHLTKRQQKVLSTAARRANARPKGPKRTKK